MKGVGFKGVVLKLLFYFLIFLFSVNKYYLSC